MLRQRRRSVEQQVDDFLRGEAPAPPPARPSLSDLERALKKSAADALGGPGGSKAAEEEAVVAFFRDLARTRREPAHSSTAVAPRKGTSLRRCECRVCNKLRSSVQLFWSNVCVCCFADL